MQISNPCVGKQYLRCMAACRIRRFYHCLHIRMHFHPHLFLFIHCHARYLACSQKSFTFANGIKFANGTFMFANGQRLRMGRNMSFFFLFLCLGTVLGIRRARNSARVGYAGWRRELVILVKANRRCFGSGRTSAMTLRAACSGLEIKENKQNTHPAAGASAQEGDRRKIWMRAGRGTGGKRAGRARQMCNFLCFSFLGMRS